MNNKKTLLIIIGMVILVLGTLGLTYAWFTGNILGNTNANSVTAKSATLSLEYTNGNEIKGENILPGWSETKTFTVENNGTYETYYKIEWGNLTNTFINKEDVTYSLTSSTNGENTPKNLEEIELPETGENISVLENIKIEPGETHTYTMHVTYANINKDQSSDIGKILTGKIEVKESRRTVDIEGQAIANGAVISNGTVEIHSEVKSAKTDENGYYKIEDVELGTHRLILKDSSNQTLTEGTIQIIEGEEELLNQNNIILSPTTKTYGVDIKVVNDVIELTKAKYNIEVIVENGIGSTTEENITDGVTKRYSVTPNEEYEYGSVSCTNEQAAQWANNILTITNLKETTTCRVRFTKKKYTAELLVTNGTGATTSTIESGTNKEFATSPATGYKYGTISCTNGQTGAWTSNKVTVSNIKANTVCTLTYNPITYTVKYNANEGTGTTTSSTHTYGAAKALTTNGFIRVGYDFLGWATTGEATTKEYSDKASVTNLTTADGTTVNLYAVWQIKTYQTSVAVTNGLVSGETTKTTNHGTSVSYTLTPSANYIYDTVTCTNGQSGSWSGNTLTINNVTNTTTCTVNFKITQFQTSVTVTNGLVTGATTKTVNYGSSPTYTVTPTSGYELDTVSCTNGQSGTWSSNTLTINNVTNTTTCTVNFTEPFEYTGTFTYTTAEPIKTWSVPKTGTYKIELWGANVAIDNIASRSSYTSGEIALTKNDTYYFYIGQQGSKSTSKTFNGGGGSTAGTYSSWGDYYIQHYSGGGATDMRTVNGTYSDLTSLYSRIMVAAGASVGMVAGGISSANSKPGIETNTKWSKYYVTGATQTAGGVNTYTSDLNGTFGLGHDGENYAYGYGSQGGAGGYYGGGGRMSRDWNESGSRYGSGASTGGSSYISGHTGSVAIVGSTANPSAPLTPRTGTGGVACTTGINDQLCSVHYSGKVFTNTKMIDGAGLTWTNVVGSAEAMPNPLGGTYPLNTGHTGNGYARITYIP